MRSRWLVALVAVVPLSLSACSSNSGAEADPKPASAAIDNKDPRAAGAPGIGPTGPGARMQGSSQAMPSEFAGRPNPAMSKGRK
jgi:hypothetical protein